MEDENIHIGRMVMQMFRYWKIYIPIGIVCLILAIIFILVTPKEYGFTARMQLRSDDNGMMSELKMLKGSGLAAMLGVGKSQGMTVEDEVAIITSRRNMGKAIREASLQLPTKKWTGLKKRLLYGDEIPVDFVFPGQFLDTLSEPIKMSIKLSEDKKAAVTLKSKLFEDKIKIKDQPLPVSIDTPAGTIQLKERPGARWSSCNLQTRVMPLQWVYEELSEDLIVKPVDPISDILAIYIRWENKKQGKDLLNSLMESYNVYSKSVKVYESEINAVFVKMKLDTITRELAVLEHQIERYKKANEIPDIELYGEAILKGYEGVEKTMLETQIKLRMLDYVIEYMDHPDNKYASIPVVEESGEKAIETYNKFVLERMRLLQVSEPDNPAVLLVDQQLAEQRKILLGTVKTLREGVSLALGELKRKNKQYTDIFYKLPTQEREYIELKRQQKIKEAMFLFLMQKLQEKEITNSPDEQAARIIDSAFQSAKPEFPKKIVVLLVAFVVACMGSFVTIYFRELRIKS